MKLEPPAEEVIKVEHPEKDNAGDENERIGQTPTAIPVFFTPGQNGEDQKTDGQAPPTSGKTRAILNKTGTPNMTSSVLLSEAANIRSMLGCMIETRLGLTAAAHVHGACRNIVFADLDGYFSHTFDPIVGGMAVKDGMITLPEQPGLGVDVDPAFLKKLKRA